MMKNKCFKIAALLLISSALASCSLFKPRPLTLSAGCSSLRANTLDRCSFKLSGGQENAQTSWTVTAVDAKGLTLRNAIDIIENTRDGLLLQSTLTPCRVTVTAQRGAEILTATFPVEADVTDADKDGFPDVGELNTQNDRRAFRAWFTTIAQSQYQFMADAWGAENRDCAGLVRFAYIEALKRHDSKTLAKYKSLPRTDIPDVAKFHYPDVPVIGVLLFRNRRGAFKPSDVADGTFANAVTAQFLQEANSHFVSKKIEDAEPGDLLFFRHYGNTNMQYHTMIFLGVPGKSAGSPLLVYHTGPTLSTGDPGKMKIVSLDQLVKVTDAQWHPTPENEYFLGVYRFDILD